MQPAKHATTLLNCLAAIAIIPLGLFEVAEMKGDPSLKWLLAALVVVFPVFIGSRIAFSAGYHAGRQSAQAGGGAPKPHGP